MRTVARFGLGAAIPLVVACALFTPQLGGGSQIQTPDPTFPSLMAITSRGDTPAPDARDEAPAEGDGPVDLFGNEITDAVAKYRFDATGSLYETHSPQTELPRLSSPKS